MMDFFKSNLSEEDEGVALWRAALHLVRPQLALWAIERYDVDVDTPAIEGNTMHPLIFLLASNDDLFNPDAPGDLFGGIYKKTREDNERRRNLAKLMEMILLAGPDLLREGQGMRVADEVVVLHNDRAVAQIILLSILQSIQRAPCTTVYEFDTEAIFARYSDHQAEAVAGMVRAHGMVHRWLNLQGGIVEKELMARHRDKLGFWLEPFSPPYVIPKKPRPSPFTPG